jgi:Asp-tRNA(Asn)/Glu-tRNA(Gln) amidotransferase A subunit family amidase
MSRYQRMILLLTTKSCYESGMTVAILAKQSSTANSTVYRRLRTAGVVLKGK